MDYTAPFKKPPCVLLGCRRLDRTEGFSEGCTLEGTAIEKAGRN